MLTLGAHLAAALDRHGPREAFVAGSTRLTFDAFGARVDATARALLALGLRPDERLALWMPNTVDWLATFFAAATLGIVVVPLNTRFRDVEVEHVLAASRAGALVMADRFGPIDYGAILARARRGGRLAALRDVVATGDVAGALAWPAFLERGRTTAAGAVADAAARVRPGDPALLLYTSGTTGAPKGAVHSHAMARTVVDGASRLGVTPRDTLLLALPFFHSMGLYLGPLMVVLAGARGVLLERFDAATALEAIAREGVTCLAGFDTHFHDLLERPAPMRAARHRLRLGILPAGLASTEPVARRVNRELCRTVSTYGSTEVGTGVCLSFVDATEDERCRGVGYPVPGYDFRAVDTGSGKDLVGAPGELWVRGYGVTTGYDDGAGGLTPACDADGWFHTGDLGVVDAEGFVRFTGRDKDMLKVGGENVDPLEVEAFLLTHPAVAQARVVGVPDARLGEVPVACLVCRPDRAVTADAIVAHCRGGIAGFKVPRHVLFVDDYPMTASGKVQRFALRERALELLKAVTRREGP